tara:strand:+ start:3882 stop:4049 length:168 start_codon:yes stop_codon:yes gene_type:complete
LLGGLPSGHLNITHEAIDGHVASGHGDQIALRWIAKSGKRTDFMTTGGRPKPAAS